MNKDVWSVVQDLSYLTCPSCICNPMLKDIPFDRNESCESVVMRGVLTIKSLAAELEQVKRERDELVTKCHRLEARNDTLIAKEVLFDEAIAAGAKMQRERDAAVAGIHCERSCRTCEYEKCKVDEEPCKSCTKGILDTWTNWQWRGVKEAEHEP